MRLLLHFLDVNSIFIRHLRMRDAACAFALNWNALDTPQNENVTWIELREICLEECTWLSNATSDEPREQWKGIYDQWKEGLFKHNSHFTFPISIQSHYECQCTNASKRSYWTINYLPHTVPRNAHPKRKNSFHCMRAPADVVGVAAKIDRKARRWFCQIIQLKLAKSRIKTHQHTLGPFTLWLHSSVNKMHWNVGISDLRVSQKVNAWM